MGIRTDRGRRLIDKCGRGGVFFKASVQPAGAVGSVTVDDEMPKLAGAVVMTMIYFPADHDAAAYARAYRQHDYILKRLALARDLFADECGVAVVFKEAGLVQLVFKVVSDICVVEGQIACTDDIAAVFGDRSG